MYVAPDRRPSGEAHAPTTNVLQHPALKRQNEEPADQTDHREFSSYIKQMQSVAMNRKVRNGNAFKVLCAIIDRTNSDTGVAWPSVATLCKDTGLSDEQVRAGLRYLEGYRKAKDGSMTIDPDEVVLDINRSIGGYNSETNEYTPRWSYGEEHRLALIEQREERDRAKAASGRRPPRKSQGVPPENSKGTTPKAPRGPLREFGDNPYDTSSSAIPMKDPSGQKQDEAEAIAPPPVPACLIDDQKRKPSGWEQPDWDDEFLIFLDRFNHETFREPGEGSNWQGAFAGAKQRGFTVDDMVVALEHDTKVSNPYGAPRSLGSFFTNYFGEGATKADVEGWRKALPRSKSTPVMMKAPAEPRLSTTSDTSRSNTYGLSPLMRRERELAYGSANHQEVEVPF